MPVPAMKINNILLAIKNKINSIVAGEEYSVTLTGKADINRTDIFTEENNKEINIRLGRDDISETTGQWYHRRDVFIDVISTNTDDVMLVTANILKLAGKEIDWDGLVVTTEFKELSGSLYANDGIKLADESIPLVLHYKTNEWEI